MKSLLLPLFLPFLLAPQANDGVALGEPTAFTFRRPLMRGMGIERLADLRGKPVLVYQWGHTTWGADECVKEVLVLQRRFGEDLAIIFSETQGGSEHVVEKMALEQNWLGTRAMWTLEYPVHTGLVGVPGLALVGVDGTLKMKAAADTWGLPLSNRVMDELEEKIEAEVELRRTGPAEVAPEVAAAYALAAKGGYGPAIVSARAAGDAAGAKAAVEEFERRADRRLERAAWMLEHGELVLMKEELDGLEEVLAGDDERVARCRELVAAREDDSQAAEREAADALAKLWKKVSKRGPKKSTPKALRKVVKQHPGTKTAARAERMAALLEE